MQTFFILLAHLITTFIKLMRPGGYRSVMAESILLKQQLIVLNRGNLRSPRLTMWDRLFFGFTASFISPARLIKNAVVIKPSTILGFHKALVQRKYRKLYDSSRSVRRKPSAVRIPIQVKNPLTIVACPT